jgi:hypothetical protein
VNFVWARGGDYEELEADVSVLGDGYPSGGLLDLKAK